MPTEPEMLKHLLEAREILKPEVRNKIQHDSYLGEKTHLQILQKGLETAEMMYNQYLKIRHVEAEREFGTLIPDLKKEIKKLTPKPLKVSEPVPPATEPPVIVKKTKKKIRGSAF